MECVTNLYQLDCVHENYETLNINTFMVYMLCAKYGFAQSMDCPVQSSDRYFAQQSMDLLHIPWIVRSVLCAKYGLSRRGFVLF